MKSNADKCHILVNSNEKVVIKISSHENANTKREKLLGVRLDGRLTFDFIYQRISKKARRKFCGLARVTSDISLSKKHTLMNAFFKSQFNYCPFIWTCHSRENNNKILRLYARSLRLYTMISGRHLMHF